MLVFGVQYNKATKFHQVMKMRKIRKIGHIFAIFCLFFLFPPFFPSSINGGTFPKKMGGGWCYNLFDPPSPHPTPEYPLCEHSTIYITICIYVKTRNLTLKWIKNHQTSLFLNCCVESLLYEMFTSIIL